MPLNRKAVLELRTKLGMTQLEFASALEQLAAEVGMENFHCDFSYISRLESGSSKNITVNRMDLFYQLAMKHGYDYFSFYSEPTKCL